MSKQSSTAVGPDGKPQQAVGTTTQLVHGTQVPLGSRFIPPRTRGDREFAGHGPDVRVRADLVISNAKTAIDLRLSMTAAETVSDWTTAEGATASRIYTAPSGWFISGMSVGQSVSRSYRDTDTDVDILAATSTTFVRKFEVVGDTSGNDAGISTGVTVFTRPFTVYLSQG